MKNITKKVQFSEIRLADDIKREARVLNIHPGAAELIAGEVTKKIEKWIMDKPTITQSDMDRKIMTEVRKYNKDLAFILGERNKLI